MASSSRMSPIAAVGIWFVALVGLGLLTVAVLGAVYTDFVDCSNAELYESANTTFGWILAIASVLMPLGVMAAVSSLVDDRWRRQLVLAAVAVAVIEMLMWVWVLTASC